MLSLPLSASGRQYRCLRRPVFNVINHDAVPDRPLYVNNDDDDAVPDWPLYVNNDDDAVPDWPRLRCHFCISRWSQTDSCSESGSEVPGPGWSLDQQVRGSSVSEGRVTWGPAGGARLVGHLGPGAAVPVVHGSLGREAQALGAHHLVLGVRGASSVLHGVGYGALRRGGSENRN